MKKLTLTHSGINRDGKQLAYKLKLEVTGAEDITKEVFVKQRRKNSLGVTEDVFAAVCSPAQLEDLQADSPGIDTSYFRVNSFEVVSENPQYLKWVLDTVINELKMLVDGADVLDSSLPINVYTIESAPSAAKPAVSEIPSTGSKSITIENPTESENFTVLFTSVPLRLDRIVSAAVGAPDSSITWSLWYGPQPQVNGAIVALNKTTTTAGTANLTSEDIEHCNIPANMFVWVTTSAKTNIINEVALTLLYTGEAEPPVTRNAVSEIPSTSSKSVTVEDPTDSENFTVLFTSVPLQLDRIVSAAIGAPNASITWSMWYGPQSQVNGTPIVLNKTTTTTGSINLASEDMEYYNITANMFIWVTTSAKTSVVDEFNLTLLYR